MLDVNHLVQAGGILLIIAIIFAESGLMVGFFLPGDTLLISAGVFAASGKLNGGIELLIPAVALAAIAGDNLGYTIGDRWGRHLFRKKDGILFRQEYVQRAEAFFEKYGNEAMLLAHFVPVVRSFAPVVAGTAEMPRKKFVLYDAIGDIAWAIIIVLVGYLFGKKIPNLDHYILIIVGLAVLASLVPILHNIYKNWRAKKPRASKDKE